MDGDETLSAAAPHPPNSLPASLRRWAAHHLAGTTLTAMLENATVMSACIVFSGTVCVRDARFHVSGLDNHQKVGSILRGSRMPLGSDMTAYKLQLPHRDGLIFDYGGNIGIAAVTSYLLNTAPGKKDGGCVRVVSIEPVPESFLMLKWNLMENGIPLMHEHQHADASACGVLALNMAASRDGRNVSVTIGYRSMNAVVEGASLAPEQGTAKRRYVVKSTTLKERLDAMRSPHSDTLDILKLDCEGCEAEVYQELTANPSLAGRIQEVTGELHGCRRGTGSSQSCREMTHFFRSRWNKTANTLQLV